MAQPTKPRPGVGTTQVDIRQVRELEAEKYQGFIAQLVLDNAVLNIALNDAQALVEEQAAKIQALSGMSGAKVPYPKPAPVDTPGPVSASK